MFKLIFFYSKRDNEIFLSLRFDFILNEYLSIEIITNIVDSFLDYLVVFDPPEGLDKLKKSDVINYIGICLL